jgi:DNA excision repair protein ERCC-1
MFFRRPSQQSSAENISGMAIDKDKAASILKGIEELEERASASSSKQDGADDSAAGDGAATEDGRKESQNTTTNRPTVKRISQRAVGGTKTVLVNRKRQKANPLLEHLKKLVRIDYNSDMKPDFVVGVNSCVLFLSLNYHFSRADYIKRRIQELGKDYDLRVLLVQIPKDYGETRVSEGLKELTKICVVFSYTMIVVWSDEEAARYLAYLKNQENAAPTQIQGQAKEDYLSQLHDVVTCVKKVNRQNAETLVNKFGSLRKAIRSQESQISTIPGWSKDKATIFKSAVSRPFIANKQYKVAKR